MRVLVLNGSPSGEDSVTLFTVKYIEKKFPQVSFETLHVGQRIRHYEKDFSEAAEKLRASTLPGSTPPRSLPPSTSTT